MLSSLFEAAKGYRCDAQTNNSVYWELTKMTQSTEFLLKHRTYIEVNKLGFGDRAFHYMWLLILKSVCEHNLKTPHLLEIGVYKGQIISLWSLLIEHFGYNAAISCITPLEGHSAPRKGPAYYWKRWTSKKFREEEAAGNFYEKENYLETITNLFKFFNQDLSKITIHKGFSCDPEILSKLRDVKFDVIYVDGDHTRAMVEQDIVNYSKKISAGGYLIMDDASCNIPGGENGVYWKGHQSVSDACEIIPGLGFKNVLNVGHNRIYQKE